MSLLSTLNTYFAFWAVRRKMFKVQNTATMNTEYLEYTILIILFMLEQGHRSCNFITHSNNAETCSVEKQDTLSKT